MPVNPDLDWAIEDVRARLPRYSLYVDYDLGNHRLLFATEKYRNTFGDLFREFADNLCDDILDGISERMGIAAWSVPGDDKMTQAAQDLWTRTRGETRTGAIHRNAFREGDGFGMLQEDRTGIPRFYKQDPRLMAVRYDMDSPDQAEVGGKVWRDIKRKRYRANLYYPDRVERYASKGLGADGGLPKAGAFALLSPGDPSLRDIDGDAITVLDDGRMPLYHYPNGEPSDYGRSLLVGVIPLQDALNKSIADMLVAMEYHAYPQRWATGVQVERDPITGAEKSPFQAGEGRVWRVGDKEARLGQFDPAAMDGFLSVQDSLRIEIVRKGKLPPHSIHLAHERGVNNPSGVALLVAEGATVKLAKDRARDWGLVHREWMAHGLSVQFNTTLTAEDLQLDWVPPETRDEQALLEALTAKAGLKVPTEQLWLEMGYTQDEIDDWLGQQPALDEGQQAALQVLQGGRTVATVGQAATLNQNLGLPGGPAASAGAGVSPLTGS